MIGSPYATVADPLFKAGRLTVERIGFGRTITGTCAYRRCRLLISRRTCTRYRGDVRYQDYLGHNVEIDVSVDAHRRCGVFRRDAELQ
jgi:hypothetical protein